MKSEAILVAIAMCGGAFGAALVVPNGNASTTGNSATPLNAAYRFQQVIGSGQFPGAIVITGFHVRSVPGKGAVNFSYPSFKITVSTTSAYPNTNNSHTLPSTTYANNLGTDAVTVYDAPLSGSSPGCSGSGPCPFDMAVSFNAPFSFDPNNGRLLIDIVASGASGPQTGSLDSVTFPDSTASTVATIGGDPTQTTGALNLGGLVLQLDTGGPLPPQIDLVANAASNRGFGSAIAQGSIFIIQGTGMGPAALAIAPSPFRSTSVSGTSVAVTVGSTTVNAPMYYTSDGQVAALLPSNTPTGTGMFTVTYNGQTSFAVGHGIAPSNPGVFTIDSSGQGPGIVTYADYSLVSAGKASNCGGPNTACGAANPGDTLILWATGLGPVNGDDASGAGLGVNMPNLPLTLWLGGVKASVTYQGRSGCCVGEDQIVFTVPNNVPTGCAVPLVVQINGQISNTTVMPVAKGSRTCTAANAGFASANLAQAVLDGPISFATLALRKDLNGDGTSYNDNFKYSFGKLTASTATAPFFLSWFDDLPLGTCIVYNNLNGQGPPPGYSQTALDGGSSFTIKGPNGSQTVSGSPGKGTPTLSPNGTFLVPGAYTVTGNGGADIGAFSATINFPSSPTLVSPAPNSTVTRANGLTVTWTGGDPNGALMLEIVTATDQTFTQVAQAACNVPAGPGTFTVPPYVMLALLSGPYAGFNIAPITTEVPFTASGLTFGSLTTQSGGTGFGFFGSGSFTLQ